MNAEKNKIEGSTLYLVGTPIGNLSDISQRAKKVLSEVDFIAAEDTRNSSKLLSVFEIRKELVSYHEHNKKESGERIISRLSSGESCALITDAGMPAISDPGENLVALAHASGIAVRVVPGPSAVVSALALSGLPTGKFAFEGFLSAKKTERVARLKEVSGEERTLVFYEAPHKLKATLADMKEILGYDRRISICRELTKINEEILVTTLSSACEYYDKNEPRGEFVLVLEGGKKEDASENPLSSLSAHEHVEYYEKSGMDRREAIKAAAKDRGMPKSVFYKLLINE